MDHTNSHHHRIPGFIEYTITIIKDVIIDCTNLEYIASSGLRILLSILKDAKAGGSRVVLRNVNEDIKNVFSLTGFINIFEFE